MLLKKVKGKSNTLTGTRIPIELYNDAKIIQKNFAKIGKRITQQDAYRIISKRHRLLIKQRRGKSR